MGDFLSVAKIGELGEGAMKEVEANGHELLLAMVDGKYYATDGRCPHMGGKLAHGKLEGTVVTCPRHGSQFDISTGQVVRWLRGSGTLSSLGKLLKGPKQLEAYRTKVDGNSVMVEI